MLQNRKPSQPVQSPFRAHAARFWHGFWAGLLLAGLLAAPALAQQSAPLAPVQTPTPGGAPASPILMLDWERLFDQTVWGRRIRADVAAASQQLSQENDRIADDLIKEERALTDRRATLDAQTFRREANAFDERATSVRTAQKAKAQALTQMFEDRREDFIDAVTPLLDDILSARGAVVVLDRRVVLRGLASADVTADLIALVDQHWGDGSSAPTAPPRDSNTPGSNTHGSAAPSTAGTAPVLTPPAPSP